MDKITVRIYLRGLGTVRLDAMASSTSDNSV